MEELVRVAIDAMGGDNAPQEPIKGAVESLTKAPHAHIILVGQEAVIREELKKYTYDESRIEIVDAPEVIETGEPPVKAIRTKKNSSIVVAERMIREGQADGFVSAGSTGAVLAGGTLIVGRLPGVKRAPLAPIIPTLKGVSLLIDCGANVDADSDNLVQFAKMGSLYMKEVMGVEDPTVGLINIGVEEEKGNALVKETYPKLKACTDIHFIGNVESREVPYGAADVLVCEAFTGNVMLKMYEGTGGALLKLVKKSMMSSLKSKLGALLVKKSLKESLKFMDASNYGGAPMLGLNGLIMKTHGNATYKEVSNSVVQCVAFCEGHLTDKIKASLQEVEHGAE